jgi:glycosidase
MKFIPLLLIPVLFFTSCKKSAGSGNTPVTPVTPVTPPVTPSDTTVVIAEPAQYGTPFTNVPDANNIVMYEVNPLAFSSTYNLAGITAGLDSIKALGVNVVWLMPTYPIGQLKSIGSPYCVQNYTAVNFSYGTLTDLQNLVAQAHSLGMSVILDWVGDHTSWDAEWISYKSWYQQDGSGNIISPPGTNWTDVAALNYYSPSMRIAMINSMKYWILAANIDGYRCDAADRIPEDFWAAAIDSLKAIPNHKLVLLEEGSNTANFGAGFQMEYGWNFFTALTNVFSGSAAASTIAAANVSENSGAPTGDYMLRFTSNHDEDVDDNTPLVLFNGVQGSLAAFVLASYMGGVPLIYDGQEVGCAVQLSIYAPNAIDWSTNPNMRTQYEQLMAFRNTSAAVRGGAITSYADNNVAAFERTSGSDAVLVLVNTQNSVITYNLDPSVQNSSWFDAMNNKAVVNLATRVSLQPYQYMILTNQ